jgi:hypothetical protein
MIKMEEGRQKTQWKELKCGVEMNGEDQLQGSFEN